MRCKNKIVHPERIIFQSLDTLIQEFASEFAEAGTEPGAKVSGQLYGSIFSFDNNATPFVDAYLINELPRGKPRGIKLVSPTSAASGGVSDPKG